MKNNSVLHCEKYEMINIGTEQMAALKNCSKLDTCNSIQNKRSLPNLEGKLTQKLHIPNGHH